MVVGVVGLLMAGSSLSARHCIELPPLLARQVAPAQQALGLSLQLSQRCLHELAGRAPFASHTMDGSPPQFSHASSFDPHQFTSQLKYFWEQHPWVGVGLVGFAVGGVTGGVVGFTVGGVTGGAVGFTGG